MKIPRWLTGSVALVIGLTACGTTVLARKIEPAGAPTDATSLGETLTGGTQGDVNIGAGGPRLNTNTTGDPKCATNSNTAHGFTESTIKWGTIIPLSGALRPLGEQTARVMKVAVNYLNSVTSVPGSFDWGCSLRPGVYGRTVELKVLSLNQNTQDEAAASMRRLIDVDRVFLVRDCYLQSNLMGPATVYQNQNKVPGIWCYFSEMPYPRLAPYNYAPGTDLLKVAAIHTGYLMNTLGLKKLAILSDPSLENNQVRIVRQVYEHITGREIPERCIAYKKAQEAPGGMQSEIQQIRTCYAGVDPDPSPNSVIALDALNGVFGAISAKNAGWGMGTVDVQWSCATCWVQTLADVCRDACQGMLTDCQALPCIPWSTLPAAETLRNVRARYLPNEPEDVLTYGPIAITLGLGLWLAMTGPQLSREGLIKTVGNLKNFDAGIGPILNTGPNDHFGGKAIWLITFNGRNFSDYSKGFLTLEQVKVPERLTTS
jgi:substrate-binding family protein